MGGEQAERGGLARFAGRLTLRPAPSVPELLLHQADDIHGLWQETGAAGPPYWAFAWLGGQALARYVLDHPALVRGQSVLDLGAGSGLVGLAAARAGAASVLACDLDPDAAVAAAANGAANGLRLETLTADPTGGDPPGAQVVLAGDLLYDRAGAPAVLAWLARAPGVVLLGDPGRDFAPQRGLAEVAAYDLEADLDLEGRRRVRVRVLRPDGPLRCLP